ncbi:MAG: inorganic phosphate transporter [Saprospiraceae bacterium]|nr:inorganic phosphate transporter [Saprospiraceae bacterium]
MEYFIYIGLFILLTLGIFDIFVGVGNDAVNFMNSAIGSKAAKFRTILWIATAGLIIGALSSAGMMEIARMGIFNPQYFSFEDVLVIFLAVMLTDIVLLDAFNTIGYPTSTTVSIVFELLGASIVVAGFTLLKDDLPMNYLFNIDNPSENITGYLNWSKTKTIISGILLSVVLAFSVGAIVMWLSRLLFSFQYQKKLKITGVIWASVAMLAMGYFLIYKGLKSTYSTVKVTQKEILDYRKSINPGANETLVFEDVITIKNVSGEDLVFTLKQGLSPGDEKIYEVFFGSKELKNIIDYIQNHLFIFLVSLLLLSFLFFFLYERMGGNPLKIVVFAGIFSLAMAFAGNDLVNFIGVPIAGLQSLELFQAANSASGGNLNPSEYMMVGLKFPLQTPYLLLLLSGFFMVLALWFSKKIKTVSETEVKLASQDETAEKFSSNILSRGIVQLSLKLTNLMGNVLPQPLKAKLNARFTPIVTPDDADAPAFDLVRASVNMAVASMLIALGTSLKLPLSTTYVTFMVAMGSSLADRAWDRESATYRIAGVFSVIGGWFITAFSAFFTSAVIAIVLINFKLAGLIFIVGLVASFIIYTHLLHKRQRIKKQQAEEVSGSIDLTTDKALFKTANKLAHSLLHISDAYSLTLEGLLTENKDKIKDAQKIYESLKTYYSDIKNNLFKAIKKSKLTEKQTAQLYILSNDMMQDILQSLYLIIESCDNHIKNSHKPLTDVQINSLQQIEVQLVEYLHHISEYLDQNEFGALSDLKVIKRNLFDNIELMLSRQVEGVYHKAYGFKNTDLMMCILLETKDLIAISVRFSKLLHRIIKGDSPLGNKDK